MSDEGVRATNNDASHCKRWCVEKRYFRDDYLKYFVHSTTAKAPEISRGYYVRVQSVRQAMRSFIKQHDSNCQIINIGAGFDTLFWNLTQEGLQPQAFVELDFPQIVMKKIRVISSKSELNSVISRDEGGCDGTKVTKGSVHSQCYHLLSIDLRDKTAVSKVVEACSLDPTLPTLVLTECVLCYMPAQSSAHLISWASTTFPNSLFLNYEPCNMSDRFGSIMIENMRSRDCELPGILACPTLTDQEKRFTDLGYSNAKAIDMNQALRQLPAGDFQRIARLEFFDEHEILTQLLEHYCLSWATQGHSGNICLDLAL
ncbi:leucine carboxyl methyltransferase 1-like [Bolinopsis microptera]|uniref:leucine carboxyl methyltransferase 1-like n=1 Tax=Bolinopsis microptera TaxID=2820187 RepID=UPI003079D512